MDGNMSNVEKTFESLSLKVKLKNSSVDCFYFAAKRE